MGEIWCFLSEYLQSSKLCDTQAVRHPGRDWEPYKYKKFYHAISLSVRVASSNISPCISRVKLTEFNLGPGPEDECGDDKFFISTNIDDERNRDRGADPSGSICGARAGTEGKFYHVEMELSMGQY